jgi:hypothetical protein
VFGWYSQFQGGREQVEDDERGGHPKLIQHKVNTTAVAADLVKHYR